MKRLMNRKGYTLVELVVTFALLSLFCTALLYVITSSLNVFRSASDRAYAQTVSATLMEKITGEIGGAQPGAKNEYGITVMKNGGGTDELSYGDGQCIAFCTRTGSQIYITSEEGRLLIHYRPVNDNGLHLDAVDWQFDGAVYQGYQIDSLTFSIVGTGSRHTNVIRTELTLRNESSGYTYTEERYVECFNYRDTTSVSKITYDAIKADNAA